MSIIIALILLALFIHPEMISDVVNYNIMLTTFVVIAIMIGFTYAIYKPFNKKTREKRFKSLLFWYTLLAYMGYGIALHAFFHVDGEFYRYCVFAISLTYITHYVTLESYDNIVYRYRLMERYQDYYYQMINKIERQTVCETIKLNFFMLILLSLLSSC